MADTRRLPFTHPTDRPYVPTYVPAYTAPPPLTSATALSPYRELAQGDLEEAEDDTDDGRAGRVGERLADAARWLGRGIARGARIGGVTLAMFVLITAAALLRALRIPHAQLDAAVKKVYGQ